MLILVGKTSSGKDTIRNELIKTYSMKPIVTYTTRPMRDGEIDGVTYHYVTKEKFSELDYEGFFAETSSYNIETGETWYYGTPIKDLNKDSIIISNPSGVKALKKLKEFDPVVAYVYCDRDMTWNRLRQRGDKNDEAVRRMAADDEDFKDIMTIADIAIKNQGMSPCYTARIIHYFYTIHNEINDNSGFSTSDVVE